MQTSCLRLLRRVTIAVSIAFGVATPTAAMADLITLATPGIKGDVTAKGQEGTIEVLSLSNDVLVPVTGGGRREGRAQVTPMIIHKRIDRASPALFLALAEGKSFQNAVITFLQTTGEKIDFLRSRLPTSSLQTLGQTLLRKMSAQGQSKSISIMVDSN